jgi:hypothetical protein
MTEPSSTPTPQETLVYQPVSAWAIAGLGIGIVCTLALGSSTVVGLFQGAPVFFPMWVLAAPLSGVVVSLIGQRHVRSSEGTRAGAGLARAGLWLSLVSGLCYFSYEHFTRLAVQNQANDFLMEKGEDSGFFPRLREGSADPDNPVQLNAAFLLTLPATKRGDIAPQNEPAIRSKDEPTKEGLPGLLSTFRQSLYAWMFHGELAKDAEVTPLAVVDWRYENRSYKVMRIYRIKTREVECEILFTVDSTEPEAAGEKRKWFVNLMETYPDPYQRMKIFTPLGKGIRLLRERAKSKFVSFVESLNKGESFAGFKERDRTAWDHILRKVPNDKQDAVRNAIIRAFTAAEPNRVTNFAVSMQPELGKWESIDGRIRVFLDFRFNLPAIEGGIPAGTMVIGYVALETREAIDPAQYTENSPSPDWDITRIVVFHLKPPAPGR